MPVPAPRGMKGVGATLAVAQGTGASPVPTVRRYIFKGDVMPGWGTTKDENIGRPARIDLSSSPRPPSPLRWRRGEGGEGGRGEVSSSPALEGRGGAPFGGPAEASTPGRGVAIYERRER